MTIDLTQLIRAEDKARAALEAARAAVRGEILQGIAEVAGRITGEVPLAEMLSWGPKEEAARAHVAGSASAEQLALIRGEAAITGEAEAALVTRILANADAYRGVVALLTGLRRKAEAGLAAAASPEAVAGVRAGVLTQLAAIGGVQS